MELYLKGTYQYCWLRPTVIRDATGMQPECCVNRFLVQHWGWIWRQGVPPEWEAPTWEYDERAYYGVRAVIAYYGDVNDDRKCQVRQWIKGKIRRYDRRKDRLTEVKEFPNVEGGKIYEHKWVRDGVSPLSSIYIDFHKDRDKIIVFDQPGITQQKATELPASYIVRFKACIIDKTTQKHVSEIVEWSVMIILLPPLPWDFDRSVTLIKDVYYLPGFGPPFKEGSRSPLPSGWHRSHGTK